MLRPMSMEFVVLAEVVDTHSIHEARLDVVSTVVVAAVVDAVLRLLLLAEIAVAVAVAATASQIRLMLMVLLLAAVVAVAVRVVVDLMIYAAPWLPMAHHHCCHWYFLAEVQQ